MDLKELHHFSGGNLKKAYRILKLLTAMLVLAADIPSSQILVNPSKQGWKFRIFSSIFAEIGTYNFNNNILDFRSSPNSQKCAHRLGGMLRTLGLTAKSHFSEKIDENQGFTVKFHEIRPFCLPDVRYQSSTSSREWFSVRKTEKCWLSMNFTAVDGNSLIVSSLSRFGSDTQICALSQLTNIIFCLSWSALYW